jgi:enolase
MSVLEDGSMGRAAVPSGASTGAHEAVELRDGDKARYLGKGVQKAVDAVNGEIFEAIGGMDAEDQVADRRDDDRSRRHAEQEPPRRQRHPRRVAGRRQGGGRRRSACRSIAMSAAPRPAPAGADDEHHQWRRPCRQPDRLPGIHDHAGRRAETSRRPAHGREVFHTLKKALKDAGHNTNVGDEGGFAPNLPSADAALDFVMSAIEKAGYKPGSDVACWRSIAPRPSSSRTASMSMKARGKTRDARSRRSISPTSSRRYPIVSIEDGMAEDDMGRLEGTLTDLIGAKCQLVGDDLFVTNVTRLRDGIKKGRATRSW